MKALVKQRAESGLWLEDVPEPAIGINDVLIRVHKTGICGTDVHIYNWDAWASRTEWYYSDPVEVPDLNDWETELAFKLRP